MSRFTPQLTPQDILSDQDIQHGLKTLIHNGLTTQAFVTLTGGTFVVAYALMLGASTIQIGILAAIPPLAQLLQIPSIYLVERFRNRRLLNLICSGCSRSLWLVIALIPFLFERQTQLTMLIVLMGAQSAVSALSGASWNSWMRDLIPPDRLGRFFSYQMMLMAALGAVVSLVAAYFIGVWKTPAGSVFSIYSVLFIIGAIIGLFGLTHLLHIPEPRMPPREQGHFGAVLLRPLFERNFRNLIGFLALWNFAINLAAPFFTVYMLESLKIDLPIVVMCGTVSQVTYVLTLRTWGRLADHFSNKTILGISGPIFLVCIFGWIFLGQGAHFGFTVTLLILLHAAMGITTAGIALASGNIGIKLAPQGQAAAYLGVLGSTNSLAAGLAPMIGGYFANFFTRSQLALVLQWASPSTEIHINAFSLQGWGFYFFFACLLGIASLYLLGAVKEAGATGEREVVQSLVSGLRREMRNYSTAGGLRRMISYPISVIQDIARPNW